MTAEQAINELKFDRGLYESEFVSAGDGTPEGDLMLALDMGIAALEKQIPKKPKGVTDPMFGDIELRCHRCDNANLANPFRCNGYAYCPDCGQALWWGDTQ